ncbi:MAG: hypothetical protein Q9171_001598 [Xanthocarpia ochracea]
MKFFIVSATVGIAILGMHGVTAILGAEAATIPTMHLERSKPDSLAERQDKVVYTDSPCWQTSTGEIRCSADKKKGQDVVYTDSPCWQTSTGEIRCSADKEKRQGVVYTDSPCWQTSTGEVRCSAEKEKRDDVAEPGE